MGLHPGCTALVVGASGAGCGGGGEGEWGGWGLGVMVGFLARRGGLGCYSCYELGVGGWSKGGLGVGVYSG